VDLTVVAEALGTDVRGLTFRRNHRAIARRRKPRERFDDPRPRGLVRCSDDRQGKEKSVGDQTKEIHKAVQALYQQGEGAFHVHRDNSKSASDFGELREEWEELCQAVATWGAVDLVPCWAINRLSRTHTEGRHFMWLCWYNDVRILVVKDYLQDIRDGGDGRGGIYSMRIQRDWATVDKAFQDAEEESRGKSEDVKRGHAGNRDKGRVDGAVPGGWVRVYDQRTGDFDHAEVVLEQAAVLVREVRLLADGTSAGVVARMLDADGIAPFTPKRKDGSTPNRFGKWSASSVVVTALNPAHIGMINMTPLGEDKRRNLADEDLAPALDYFPVVRGRTKEGAGWTAEERAVLGWHGTEDEWAALWRQARDSYLARRSGAFEPARHVRRDGTPGKPYGNNIRLVRPGGSRHLQSYIATCDVCGGPLRTVPYPRGERVLVYLACERSGHVSVREDWADAYVGELVADKLSRLIRHGGYQATDPGELARLLREQEVRAAYWEANIADLELPGNDDEHATKTRKARRDMAEEVARRDAEINGLAVPAVLRGYWDTAGDPGLIAARWAGKDRSAQRAELKVLTKAIRVRRSPLGRTQALRLPEDQRRLVARGQVDIEWADEYRQDGDSAHADDGGERITAIPQDPDPAAWGIPPEGWKWCSGECRQMLPADEEHFYRRDTPTDHTRPTADGWSNVCRTCHRARVSRGKAERKARQAGVVPGEGVSA
jgi:Resolvase, N terminal domain